MTLTAHEKAVKRAYYAKNRTRLLARAKERHERNLASPTYRALALARKNRWNFKESIALHRRRIRNFESKVRRINRRIEELELQWGAERAARKRAAKRWSATGQRISP